MTQRHNVISREQLIGLVALTLMWGLNWPMMKLSLRELPALYFRSITMAMGAAWLGVYYMRQGIRMWPQGREWRDIVVLGVPNILLWHSFAILGVQALPSGRASILGFTMPVWTGAGGLVHGRCFESAQCTGHGGGIDGHWPVDQP